MDFDLSEEHQMIRDMTRQFADEVIAPRAEQMEESGEFPYDIFEKMAELGMVGIPFPEEYGGSGGDWVGMHLCIEEISRADGNLGALLDVTTSVVGQEIFVFGTEEQKKEFLVPIARGEKVGAFGLTEPDSGSDAGSLRTSAVKDGDSWVLNGTKQFITGIGLENASVMLTAARSGMDGEGRPVISAFIVPKGTPGMSLGKKYRKLAGKALPANEVILEDCRIPLENILGDPGRGFAQHLAVLETGRISIGAVCVGMARACLEQALSYARERTQFGKPIFHFQAVQFKLADMSASIELARNQVIKAAWLKDRGRRHTFEATVAKLYGSEMLERVASDAVQIHGGYGYMDEYPVSRMYKGAKLLQIVEGTSEVQRMILGRILQDSGGKLW
ncbi:MAG: acyl-CoA dehydrogenase family protein [Deltaproteobacteria bacterium]|nr:acyl-CoA dehydrogenase family protein [Deltaproteobacteria bacterium]MBW1923703.1 acyl-CoA dehydrogenase family protein [Deltaproteobacteria bacterium]MBW1950310.1 acyl-CoA dehydrogenase family protein [Deltaproteobacteria bacterium]MBW2008390.1 acyl-CoA dehydrogenase family protein [Deltaproteobacteria bacterium]MBW2347743.1 acyl-CoA dehydrogenase family protein [Deltaproteobacteria bacterium]